MKFNELRRSFFRKRVQIRRYFATMCTIRGTRGAKLPVDATFSGRSMVEMLGVLAIIGVLSVGAISGYSAAMTKYKLNKQTEQISQLVSAVIRYRSGLKMGPHNNVLSIIPYLRRLNEIPQEMLYPSTDTKYDEYLRDSFNNKIMIFHHDTNYIGINISLENNAISRNTCRNIYLLAKEFSGYVSRLQISLFSEDTNSSQNLSFAYGDRTCVKGSLCLKDLKVTDTEKLCSVCSEGTRSCSLIFYWPDNF